MMQDGSPPNPEDAAEYLRKIAQQASNETFQAFKDYLVTEILPKLPTHEGIVREVVATMNAKADQTLQEFGTRIGQIEKVLTGASPQLRQAQAGADGNVLPLRGTLTIPGTTKSLDLTSWGALFEYAFDKFLKFQEARIRMTDPFSLAAKIREIDPVKAAIAGQLLYPNPMEQYAPALAATVGANAFRQGMNIFVPLIREGVKKGTWQLPELPPASTPSAGSPAWYGGPSAPGTGPQSTPQPQSVVPNPAAATMSGSRSGPGQPGSGQDTVRVSRQLNNRPAPKLRDNFR